MGLPSCGVNSGLVEFVGLSVVITSLAWIYYLIEYKHGGFNRDRWGSCPKCGYEEEKEGQGGDGWKYE